MRIYPSPTKEKSRIVIRCCFFLLFFISCVNLSAATSEKNIFINRGSLRTVDTTYLPYLAFNESPAFNARNAVITLKAGDTLTLHITNRDTVVHGFTVRGKALNNKPIQPGTTHDYSISFDKAGVYIFYDSLEYPKNSYLGLAGMICVYDGVPDKSYFWNLKEHESGRNFRLAEGQSMDWKEFKPDYFTFNSLSNPELQNDSTAVVRGKVGNLIYIYVANTGLSTHSVHFHGYHLRILSSSHDARQISWVKDTFRVPPMESMLLELIPDKPGLFPVHDHNLVANTGGLVYPNGMFLMMEITE